MQTHSGGLYLSTGCHFIYLKPVETNKFPLSTYDFYCVAHSLRDELEPLREIFMRAADKIDGQIGHILPHTLSTAQHIDSIVICQLLGGTPQMRQHYVDGNDIYRIVLTCCLPTFILPYHMAVRHKYAFNSIRCRPWRLRLAINFPMNALHWHDHSI